MKKNSMRLASLILVFSALLSVSAFAVARASDQISYYYVDVNSTGKGKIEIEFSITGTHRMNVLGAQTISVYESWGSNWMLVKNWDAADGGITASSSNNYGNTLYYTGTSGTEYKVEVTVFAEDSDGSDSRTETRYITA